MASTREFLDFVLAQIADAGHISSRAMMGEFVIYCGGKVVGGIYDNRFLLKPTKSAVAILDAAGITPQMEIPYPKAKPMIAADIDDSELCCRLIQAIANDLPAPKKKG